MQGGNEPRARNCEPKARALKSWCRAYRCCSKRLQRSPQRGERHLLVQRIWTLLAKRCRKRRQMCFVRSFRVLVANVRRCRPRARYRGCRMIGWANGRAGCARYDGMALASPRGVRCRHCGGTEQEPPLKSTEARRATSFDPARGPCLNVVGRTQLRAIHCCVCQDQLRSRLRGADPHFNFSAKFMPKSWKRIEMARRRTRRLKILVVTLLMRGNGGDQRATAGRKSWQAPTKGCSLDERLEHLRGDLHRVNDLI